MQCRSKLEFWRESQDIDFFVCVLGTCPILQKCVVSDLQVLSFRQMQCSSYTFSVGQWQTSGSTRNTTGEVLRVSLLITSTGVQSTSWSLLCPLSAGEGLMSSIYNHCWPLSWQQTLWGNFVETHRNYFSQITMLRQTMYFIWLMHLLVN